MKFLIGIIVVLFVLLSVVLYILARYAVKPTVHTLEYELEYLDKYDCMQGESREITNEHTIETYDGQSLWVGLVPGNPENKHYVVLSHGYTSTRYGMYKYAALWRKLGYNCVLYDNRGHGANKPTTITFGVRESRDLMAVIEDTYERYGRDIHIGLHGESMGAGLQLMTLSHGPKVDFIVNDCGYSFTEVQPIERLRTNEIPICFVHGTSDTFTAHWRSEKMYEANKGYKELHLFEGVDHAECIMHDATRYFDMMKKFVETVYAEV